jgi:DNA-binding winged helix-turn-helix (wHTH) protein
MSGLGTGSIYEFGDFKLDLGRRALLRCGEAVALTPKEFQTLCVLVEAEGQAVERERLIRAVWPDTVVGDTSLARNISLLRRQLGAESIKVLPKYGYRFSLPVQVSVTKPALEETPAIEEWQTELPSRMTAWRWGAIAVAILLVGAAAKRLLVLKPVTADSREGGALSWTDPQTGLVWARKDNGMNVTREQALSYCQSLVLDGRRSWRLPTIEELQTLVDPGVSVAGTWGGTRAVYWHVKGNLQPTGGETASDLTWLSELTPAGEEQSYDFSYGRRNYDDASFSADHRALCVR